MSKPALMIGAALIFLTACAGGQRSLHNMEGTDGGADEFSVLPTAPIERPADLRTLPTPTPGAPSRVDPTPRADAIVALGGRPDSTGTVPGADAALVAATGRSGVDPAIRQTLATEDAAFRSGLGRGLFSGLFGGNRYFATYARQKLDAYAELARLRGLGIDTPTAPPAP